ncbi:methyl-accepting chemotaxis protein, partial [Klebsiella pneumoniae]|nr:methyl-accepting chemotaxis protein [Klebsiella pneumoniae]
LPAREGAEVFSGSEKIGTVTSGGFSPTLQAPIAMAYVAAEYAAIGTALEVEVRGKRLAAKHLRHHADQRIDADDLSRRTEEQAANLEETAGAITSINSSVRESAATSATARTTINATSTRAQDGAQIVTEAVAAMQQIESSSQEINSIIAVIETISFQTNLLALNAGVEAARAGEAGKGFAVVASEVRDLAQRSAESATAIKQLVATSKDEVAVGVARVQQLVNLLASLVARFTDIAGQIDTIAMGSQ